ncbi:MAG: hypothetical protein ABH887_02245 [bacterium]
MSHRMIHKFREPKHPKICYVLQDSESEDCQVISYEGKLLLFTERELAIKFIARVNNSNGNNYFPVKHSWNAIVRKFKKSFVEVIVNHKGIPGTYQQFFLIQARF